MTCICKDCGCRFELTDGERKFYEEKGLSLPRRCKACREKNKNSGGNGGNKPASGENKKPARDNNSSSRNSAKLSSAMIKKYLIPVLAFIVAAVVAIAGRGKFGGDNQPAPDVPSSGVTQQSSGDETVYTAENTTVYDSGDYSGAEADEPDVYTVTYTFRNSTLLNQHYEKHGKDMGFASPEEYESAASAVINNPDALRKTEAEDGDGVYYITATNEFVILSTDGYIRTYFCPDGGLAYYERQ